MLESKAIPRTNLALEDVKRLRLEPGDILALKLPEDANRAAAEQLIHAIHNVTGVPVIALASDVEMHVLDDQGSREWLREIIREEIAASKPD